MTTKKKKSLPKEPIKTAKQLPEKIKKAKIDWEAVEREYRAGSLSVAEIARQNNVSHQAVFSRAKKKAWSRDLTADVRKRINQKLVADAVAGCNVKAATDDEVAEAAANRGAEVVKLHRKDITNLRRLEESLINELQNNPTKLYLAQFQGQIIEKIVLLTASERAMAANNLANVQHKRIALERQAYNLGDGGGNPDPIEEITVNFIGTPERE